VVRPAIAYGATVWHTPSAGGKPASKEKTLETLQNTALRNITGAFKKINTEILEAEAYFLFIYLVFNRLQIQTVLRMKNAGRKREIRRARDLIRTRLVPRRGRPHRHKTTPNETKDKNTTIILEKAFTRAPEILLNTPLNTRKAFRKYFRNE
jgi:hypothetical protein